MPPIPATALTHLHVLEVAGPDGLQFLQGQCTQDVQQLPRNSLVAAAFCNAKGRVISNVQLLLLQHDPARVLMLCHQSAAATLHTHLRKYAVFFRQMQFSYQPEAYHLFGISTPDSDLLAQLRANTALTASVAWGSERGILIVKDNATALPQDLLAATEPLAQWQVDDIRESLLWLDGTQAGCWIPQNVNLDELGALSFSKGCYTGQEVVARLHYKGASKKRLYRLVADSHLQPTGTTVRQDGKAVGTLLQQASVGDHYYALAVLKTPASASPSPYYDESEQLAFQLLN